MRLRGITRVLGSNLHTLSRTQPPANLQVVWIPSCCLRCCVNSSNSEHNLSSTSFRCITCGSNGIARVLDAAMARRDIVLVRTRIRQFRWVNPLACPIRPKRKPPRDLWLKTTWFEMTRLPWFWPDDGQLLLANSRLPLPPLPPSSSFSSPILQPFVMGNITSCCETCCQFSPSISHTPKHHIFNLVSRFQSGPISPSRMSPCCWKTSGRPWRTFCSS